MAWPRSPVVCGGGLSTDDNYGCKSAARFNCARSGQVLHRQGRQVPMGRAGLARDMDYWPWGSFAEQRQSQLLVKTHTFLHPASSITNSIGLQHLTGSSAMMLLAQAIAACK